MNKAILFIGNERPYLESVANYVKEHGFPNYKILNYDTAFSELITYPENYTAIILETDGERDDAFNILKKISTSSVLKTLPIILYPEAESQELAAELIEMAIKQGVRYCLPQPGNQPLTIQILQAAAQDYERHLGWQQTPKQEKAVYCLESAFFKFKTLQDAHAVALFIAEACPNPRLAIVGITEILVNAIEHGNLGITSEEKEDLLREENAWLQEIERRLKLPQNNNKYVEVHITRDPQELRLKVKDQGKGFNWRDIDKFKRDMMFNTHGRGITMAKNLIFKEVRYMGVGNEVECIIAL